MDSEKPPCVVLYDDRQINDMQRFCTTLRQSVLGIDRTFNLGKCFVMVTTYKYVDVVRNRTGEPPVFLGPMYLHWNVTTSTYANFLNHLRVKLACDVDTGIIVPPDVMVGSDDERALHTTLVGIS